LLRRYGGEWDFLGDWLWPGAQGVNGDTRETLFFNNCYWVYNLQTASHIAEALGRQRQALAWRARADAVRHAVHAEFFNPSDASYVNGFEAYQAIALLTDVPPREWRPAVARRLEAEILEHRRGHFWAGITGGSFLVRELIQSERPDLMFTMVSKQDYPSWGYMLAQGATSMWEDWEGKLSQCHSSYLHVGSWFIEGLAGIQPGANGRGYQEFDLRPAPFRACPLQWMSCRFDSPYGLIESSWRRQPDGVDYEFVVPPNSSATLYLPGLSTDPARESRVTWRSNAGIRDEGRQDAHRRLKLEPGHYKFRVHEP
jgi:alpha-L-rhamnosidase